MLLANIVGFACAIIVLGSYWWSARTSNPRFFHLFNAIFSPPMLVANIYLGAYFGALLNVAFGGIAVYGLFKDK